MVTSRSATTRSSSSTMSLRASGALRPTGARLPRRAARLADHRSARPAIRLRCASPTSTPPRKRARSPPPASGRYRKPKLRLSASSAASAGATTNQNQVDTRVAQILTHQLHGLLTARTAPRNGRPTPIYTRDEQAIRAAAATDGIYAHRPQHPRRLPTPRPHLHPHGINLDRLPTPSNASSNSSRSRHPGSSSQNMPPPTAENGANAGRRWRACRSARRCGRS